MAELNFKTEFKSSPSPEARLASLQVNHPLFEDEKKPANVTPEPSPPKVTWKHCKKFDPLIQVETKEKAVKNATTHLAEIDRSLRRHLSEVPSASKWIERISRYPLLFHEISIFQRADINHRFPSNREERMQSFDWLSRSYWCRKVEHDQCTA